MSYELKREDIFSFAATTHEQTREKGNELVFRYCPYCHGGNHHDRDTFSINLEKGVYKCLRASCGRQGHFVELCRDFHFPLESAEQASRRYRQLPQPSKPPEMRQSSLEYLASRGIGRETAERYGLTARKDQPNILCFPFFDLQGRLVSIKYRNMRFRKGVDKCKEWFEKDTQPILFGLQCWNGSFDRAIITEGQLDSLSLSEAGIENAFSVPNGCSGFTWVASLSEWLNQFREIIIFGDWENGRMSLLDPLMQRLQVPLRAVRQEDYLQEKDANDILRKFGPEALRRAIEGAEPPRVERVRDLASVQRMDLSALEKVRTGFREIDRAIGGLIMGQVALISGERGQGKSTFLSQIIANALDQRDPQGNPYGIFVYSGELQDYLFRNWLDFQLAGKEHIDIVENEYGEETGVLQEETAGRISEWYRGRIWLYDDSILPEDGQNATDLLLETVEKVIRQYGCRIIALDNLMTALDGAGTQNELNLGQSAFVGRVKKIAMKYNVCILLVAHPRKSYTGIRMARTLDNDDISGSGDITNKVDVVLTCSRDPERENSARIQILKNRLYGRLKAGENAVRLNFSPLTRRMFAPEEGRKVYGWEKGEETINNLEALGYELCQCELPF
ncbi:MAG: AAA family ATPase [Clostridia bacterium]|nr:AAA family ATPase [Clostridia bacterium]